MKKIKSLFEIILPSAICVILIITTKMSIEYYPISFGLVIGIFNWNYHRHPPVLGIILSLILSYVSFIIGYFSFPLLLGVLKPMLGEDSGGIVAITLAAYAIAPFLVLSSYKLVFHYKKYKSLIIIGCIFLLIIIFRTLVWYSDIGSYKFKLNELSYTIWQVIVALSIQLLIDRKEISKDK